MASGGRSRAPPNRGLCDSYNRSGLRDSLSPQRVYDHGSLLRLTPPPKQERAAVVTLCGLSHEFLH
jgi:hypothetical protein